MEELNELDKLAAVASNFLQIYSKAQAVTKLKQQLTEGGEDFSNLDDAPLYQKVRIHLVSVIDEVISADVPVRMDYVVTVGHKLSEELYHHLQLLAEAAPRANDIFQKAFQCPKTNPSTSPAPSSTATTATASK